LKTGPVAKGDKIKVEYLAKLEDGSIIDRSEGRWPLEFVVGKSKLIKGFDDAVIGMKLGEEKTVTVRPEDAYGHDSDEHPLGGKTLIFWIKVIDIRQGRKN